MKQKVENITRKEFIIWNNVYTKEMIGKKEQFLTKYEMSLKQTKKLFNYEKSGQDVSIGTLVYILLNECLKYQVRLQILVD